MPIYKYIRNLRYTLATALGFGFICAGLGISAMMIMNDYNEKTSYHTLFGIPSYYYMLLGFVLAFLYFFKRSKTRYYLVVCLGSLIGMIMSILEFFNVCDCGYFIEEGVSVCNWIVVLFGGAFILKKLE